MAGSFDPVVGEGIINLLRRRYAQTESDLAREHYQKHMITKTCSTCNGNRLNIEALAVKINNISISDFGNLSIRKAKDFIENLQLTDYERSIAQELLKKCWNGYDF